MKNDRYEDSDFTHVADAAGTVQADQVPKAWVGTDLLPTGWKAAKAPSSQSSSSGS